MAIEAFKDALHDTELEQHLLTVGDTSLRKVVDAAAAWLGIHSANRSRHLPCPRVAALAEVVAEPAPESELVSLVKQLAKSVESNNQAIAKISVSSELTRSQGMSAGKYGTRSKVGPCFNYRGPHMKRDCPELQQSGNANRSQ